MFNLHLFTCKKQQYRTLHYLCIKLQIPYSLYNFKSEYYIYSIIILYENFKVISNYLITFLM